ncbi:TIGR04141 family sporadically distributed protein [Xanthomonas sacchari]|uniref:TIGR04141 family sporadically distributed protein n=1 Tax=Xanthomonas sacchari TaxID=56458 RepID=UPI00224F5F5B|nr:TIGR04141 family sporadically distributed protein [Xanthomonas sacchari]
METNPRKEKLSIYLLRDGINSIEACLKEEMISSSYVFPLVDGDATLLLKRAPPERPPIWTRMLTEHPNAPDVDFGSSKSVGAVLHIAVDHRKFLISFGTGFHLIRGEALERDFGLRVTLNSVDPDKLRSLDKASYDDNPLSSRTQSTLQADIFDLQVNSELDLVYAITGACKFPLLGTHVTGRDALTLMVETKLNGIKPILAKALELFEQKLPPTYAWIDNVARIRDAETIELLDMLLDDLIKGGSTEIWLGEPEIIDWESNSGYSFDMYPNTPRHQVLTIDDLNNHIISKGLRFNLDSIKLIHIHINDQNYNSIKEWQAYRCIYAEVTDGDNRYVLRNGSWLKIESSFINQIDRQLANIEVETCSLPPYSFANEGEYNKNVCVLNTNLHLMDKDNIRTGGPYDKIEFCDLIEGQSKFIHVKYYRSSATLSHLFAQGAVAAETFLKDEEFRKKLNSKLPTNLALSDTRLRPDAGKYKITYAIATNKSIPSELPFFSKISLKNAASQLGALGYKVSLTAIPVDPALLITKKFKPKSIKK